MIEDIIRHIVGHLVSRPEAISIEEFQGRTRTVYRVCVAPEDAGVVIGRAGRTINAIRMVLNASITSGPGRVWMELVEADDFAQGTGGHEEGEDLGSTADETDDPTADSVGPGPAR